MRFPESEAARAAGPFELARIGLVSQVRSRYGRQRPTYCGFELGR